MSAYECALVVKNPGSSQVIEIELLAFVSPLSASSILSVSKLCALRDENSVGLLKMTIVGGKIVAVPGKMTTTAVR